MLKEMIKRNLLDIFDIFDIFVNFEKVNVLDYKLALNK